MDVKFGDRRLPLEFWQNTKLVRASGCWRWRGPAEFRYCGMRRTPWVVAYEVLLEVHPPRGPHSLPQCDAGDCVNPEHRPVRVVKKTRHHVDLSDWLPVTRQLMDRRGDAWSRSVAACMVLALLQQDEEWLRTREVVRSDLVAA